MSDAGGGDDEDKVFVRDTLRLFEVDAPTFSYKLETAAEGGSEVKKAELDWSAMDAETHAELEKLFGDKETITVEPSALERRFTIPERNRAIVREYRQVLDQGYIDAKGVLRMRLLGKAIVFAVTKKHAETLAQLFHAEFAHLKPSPDLRFADYVVSGLGADDTVDGMSKIRRFKKEPFLQMPRLPLQRAFEHRVQSAESILNQQAEALNRAMATFDAILSRACS